MVWNSLAFNGLFAQEGMIEKSLEGHGLVCNISEVHSLANIKSLLTGY
jgi:hypothetical protein